MIYIYSLLLVDDERKVLDNIVQVFDWAEMGFVLGGTFTSAQAALKYMENNTVDLVISDISMPRMSGLEFAEIVLEKYPRTKFVVLSAYREFNYVQKAISCGVTDYILKPITYSKIEEVLNKVKTALDKQKMVSHIHYTKKHKLLSDILNGKLTDVNVIKNDFQKEGIYLDIDNTPIVMVRVSVNNFEDFLKNSWMYESAQFQNAFSFVVEDSQPNIIVAKHGYGTVEMFIVCETELNDKFLESMNRILTNISNNCFENLNCHTEFEIVRIFMNIKDLIGSNSSEDFVEIHLKKLLDCIVSGNIFDALDIVEKQFSIPVYGIGYFRHFVQCLVVELNNMININAIITDHIPLSQLFVETSVENIKNYISMLVEKSAVYFLGKNKNSESIIDNAKEFIKNNYDRNILLSDIANAVYISESHLSRTFKIKTGESIMSYLSRVRLRHAQELLVSSSMNIDDVCFAVGYKSRNLFYKNFKDLYGVTPKKYRRENTNGE